jgi:hypothetical protein
MTNAARLKKTLKTALWVAGGFVGLVAIGIAVAAFVINKHYPPEKIKEMVTVQLASKIHRKIALKDVSFSLFSGFRLTGLSVSNRAGWTNQPFLAAEEASVGYRLLPLLWLQLQLGEVRLVKPVILVERKGPTEYNFTDLMGASSATAPTGSAASSSNAAVSKALSLFTVARVTLQDGKITYIDHLYKPAMRVELPKTNVTIKNISLSGGKTTFEVDAPIVYGGTTYALALKGSERFDWKAQTLKALKVEGTFQGVKFKLTGGAKTVVDDFAPDMKGEATLDLAKVGGLMPKSMGGLPKDLALSGVVTAPFQVGGTLKKGFALEGTLDLTASEIAFGKAFQKAKGVTAKASYRTVVGTDYVKVPSFDAALAAWVLKGSMAYTGMEAYPGDPKAAPAVAVSVSAPSLPIQTLGELSPLLKGWTLSGSLGLDVAFSALMKNPKAGTLRGGVNLQGIEASGAGDIPLVQGMTGRVSMTDTSIEMPKLAFKLMGTPAVASLKMGRFHSGELLDFAKCNALINFALDAGEVDLERLMSAMGSSPSASKDGDEKSSGTATAPLDLRGVVSDGLQMGGRVTFKGFRYRELKMTNAVAQVTLAKRQFKTTATVAGFSGTAAAVVTADLTKAPLPYGFSIDLKGVSAKTAINDAVDSFVKKKPESLKDKVTGTMDLKFAGTGRMDAKPADSLRGNGTFLVSGATVQGVAMLGGVVESLKDDTKALKMDKLDGTLAVADRKVALTANSAGDFGRLRVKGAVDFDGVYAPEMRVETDVRKALVDSKKLFGALSEDLQRRIDVDRAADAQGYVPVDFKLTGEAAKAPSLKSLDVTRLTKNVTSSYTKQITNKVTEKTGATGEAVGKALKGLFKR